MFGLPVTDALAGPDLAKRGETGRGDYSKYRVSGCDATTAVKYQQFLACGHLDGSDRNAS